jgi:hypothetical protein
MTQPHFVGGKRTDNSVTTGGPANLLNVLIEGKPAAVAGDLDTHNMLGAIISMSPGSILVNGIPMAMALMDNASPDVEGIIPHVEGLPTPAEGAATIRAYGPNGTFGGGLGAFQALMGGGFGIPGVGEIMQLGTQVIGQVSRVANQGGGTGVVVMNNMPPAVQSSITSGSTITSANTGYTFTFSNYYSS